MYQPIQFKKATPLFLVPFVLACFAFLPQMQAVSPPPGGGYPGGNTAEGQSALLKLTSGGYNTAVGFFSLGALTTGAFNTGVGAGSLLANTTASQNTATGAAALLSNTTGNSNTANGAFALFSNTTGVANTAIGDQALFTNTTANGNTAIGTGALLSNTTGADNTAIGDVALEANTTGVSNTAVGTAALASNTIAKNNTAIGYQALSSNTTGNTNTAIGIAALPDLTIGVLNTAVGSQAGFNVITAGGVICIGANVGGADVSNTCFIGNIRGVTTQNADALPVLVDSAGQLGTTSSSRRFKKEIKPMDKVSDVILALKPVTFQYRTDNTNTPQFGLIAEEVAKVNPDLVVRDKSGEVYTVRYDAVNAMLLNEFLKEHHQVQELKSTAAKQEATIAELKSTVAEQQKGIKALTAGLQKVSAQLEVRKPAPQTVLNNQ